MKTLIIKPNKKKWKRLEYDIRSQVPYLLDVKFKQFEDIHFDVTPRVSITSGQELRCHMPLTGSLYLACIDMAFCMFRDILLAHIYIDFKWTLRGNNKIESSTRCDRFLDDSFYVTQLIETFATPFEDGNSCKLQSPIEYLDWRIIDQPDEQTINHSF